VGGYYAGFDWYGIRYTRDDGVFVLSDIGAGAWMRFVVSSPGIGRAVLDRVKAEPLDALSPADRLTIELWPYLPLTVRVQQAGSNEPLAGALVTLLEDEPDFSGGFSWGYDDLWAERRRSGADGVARFAEPACEDGTIIVRASGFARKRVAWTDGAQEVQVSLVPEAILHGEARMDGRRLAEGYARLTSAALDHMSVDLAATEGRFEFDQLPPGEYTLEISGNGERALYSHRVKLEGGKARAESISITSGKNAAAASK
jgi:hypothetical protein